MHDAVRHLLFGQTTKHSLLVFCFPVDQDILDIIEPLILDKAVDFRMFLFVFLKKEQNIENVTIITFL